MKDTFDFPVFSDLQLGPLGEINGCGCLETKRDEIIKNSDMGYEECERFDDLVIKKLGGRNNMISLTRCSCPNTLANRRKAYRALETAIGKMGYDLERP